MTGIVKLNPTTTVLGTNLEGASLEFLKITFPSDISAQVGAGQALQQALRTLSLTATLAYVGPLYNSGTMMSIAVESPGLVNVEGALVSGAQGYGFLGSASGAYPNATDVAATLQTALQGLGVYSGFTVSESSTGVITTSGSTYDFSTTAVTGTVFVLATNPATG